MFAMTINVAMVVHDKINLQNAADFASIYVAQRQAEMLNAIAHTNYQIRQAHKLLAYRYVVLGTAGISGSQASKGFSTDEANPDVYAQKDGYPFCVADSKLFTFPGGSFDNYCSPKFLTSGFGGITIPSIVNPFSNINSALKNLTIQVGDKIQDSFSFAGAVNWYFLGNIMASYRFQISYRKAVIKALANNLMKPIVSGDDGMKDLYGRPVYDGAKKTFEYNLSESSRRMGGWQLQIFNSMEGLGSDESQWLPQINTYLAPVYADFISGSGPGGSDPIRKFLYQEPNGYQSPITKGNIENNLMFIVDPDAVIKNISSNTLFTQGSDFEEILGFEKNPWYMVYNHVQVQAVSGALFSPTPGLSLSAQAFSKPFGGRIGPWFGKDWPNGSPRSSDNNKLEPLLSFRNTTAGVPTSIDLSILPNAPKYPGDRIGFKSLLAQSSTNILGNNNPNGRFDINDYKNITFNLLPDGNGQALPENGSGGMRDRELAILAPDLFDITYYSIETNFHENYLEGKLDIWLPKELIFSDSNMSYQAPLWRDIGFQFQPQLANFNVRKQFETTPYRDSGFARQVFYFLDNSQQAIANVLTSWVSGKDVGHYRTPADTQVKNRFGNCGQNYKPGGIGPNIPGECLVDGGRTGYSVKMISKEYLLSNEHRMSANSVGPILNPPKSL